MFGETSFENLDISNDDFFNLSDDEIYTFERRRLLETSSSTEALASSSQLSSSSQAESQQLPTQELITSVVAQTATATAEVTPKMPKRELSLNSLCRTVSIIKKVKFGPHQQESETESSNSDEESEKRK